MNAESLSARAAEAGYAAWTKTEDYRKEADRLREIVHRLRKDFGEDIEFTEAE